MSPKLSGYLKGLIAPCPKCARDGGIVSYCAGCPERHKVEHLHCACTQCGYSWLRRCADATSDTRKGKRRIKR